MLKWTEMAGAFVMGMGDGFYQLRYAFFWMLVSLTLHLAYRGSEGWIAGVAAVLGGLSFGLSISQGIRVLRNEMEKPL